MVHGAGDVHNDGFDDLIIGARNADVLNGLRPNSGASYVIFGRSLTEATSIAGNVDGDTDFDANDSFLIQLVKLSGTDAQIDQSFVRTCFSAAKLVSSFRLS